MEGRKTIKFNLYIPSKQEKKKWERYARKDNRSLSQFIRIAVQEKIARMRQQEDEE
jgi:hypothetical protein